MPTVFDNIETPFLDGEDGNGLKHALKLAKRGDFCVGYFNLRGWRCIDGVVNGWKIPDGEDPVPPARLLVGMQRLPHEELRAWLSNDVDRAPDNKTLSKLRKDAANEFRRQLTIGNPTDNDEAGLRRLVKQLKEGRLRVKLFLKHALHAKLYLAHRDDSINPIIAYIGSSNLTMAGLKGQGELNIDVVDKDAARKLSDWFVARWEDSRCLDITEELIEIIEESWAKDILPPLTDAEDKIIADLSRAGKRMKGFCRTNLFKRLESSANAFLLSIHRHILRNHIEIHALENGLPLPIGQQDASLLDTRLHDFGDGELDLDDGEEPLPPLGLWDESHYRSQAAAIYQTIRNLKTKRYKWLRTDVFKKTLLRDLKADTASLHGLLVDTGEIPTSADYKLQALVKLRKRLVHRLRENEEVVGSDESFFEDQTALDEDALRNLYDEKSGILDEPEDDEVDLTSEAFEVWSQATKNDKALRDAIEKIPDVVYATKAHIPHPDHPAQTPPGVLCYIRTPQDHDALIWIDSEGKTVTESLVRIFRQAKCTAETPALPRRDDHHELVARSVKIVQEERTITKSGQLGSSRGVRYKSDQMFDDYLLHREGDLFLTDRVRAAIQAIYDSPLTTEAADKLNRQLRSGITADDLANLVTTLHRDDRLVVANLHDAPAKEPRILCSLGLA